MKPLLTVLLPVKNARNTIERSLSSILNQSFEDLEVLVLENGSTDGTADFVRQSFADKRIRLFTDSEACIVKALNKGISLARGEFIARMDADDFSDKLRFERQLDFFKHNPKTIVLSTQVEFETELSSAEGLKRYVDWTNSLVTEEDIRIHRFIESPVIHPSIMMKKSFLEKAGGYRKGLFPEDYELWLRMMDAGMVFSKIAEKLVVWTDHNLRLTRTDLRYDPQNFFKMKAYYLARFLIAMEKPSSKIYIWGAGKKSSQRALFLEDHGVTIEGFIDVDPDKINQRIKGKTVHDYKNFSYDENSIILVYVGNYGARGEIEEFLKMKGKKVGEDFFFCA